MDTDEQGAITSAICFKCGAEKSSAWLACSICGVRPQTNSELAVSLVLSGRVSSKGQLGHYCHEIINHLKMSIPREVLAQALETIKDPNLRVTISREQASVTVTSPLGTPSISAPNPLLSPTPPPASASDAASQAFAPIKGRTVLHQVAFAVLGSTTRDDRRRIVELAEERSLDLDHEVCQKASSDLTNPRTRLSAEIAWLPGVSPRKATQLLETVNDDPFAVRAETGLPILAHLNLLSAAFESVDEDHGASDFVDFIQEMASLAELLDATDVMRDINEDRAVSGFPEVRSIDLVEEELSERKRIYRTVIKDALDRLPSETLVRVMTDAVDNATAGGVVNALAMIDDLVDSYEVESQGFLQQEAENVRKLIKFVRDAAGNGEAAVQKSLEKLVLVARNWDRVAQPIQLSSKARGINHVPSRDLAHEIRDLGIDLFNKHGMLEPSQRITRLLQELFTEIPDVAEQVDRDQNALTDIFNSRQKAAKQRQEWAHEISYRAEIGMVFKDTLSISEQGISWKQQIFPLDTVARVRWGGVRHSVNGIPTGTTYTIGFGDKNRESVVELKNETIYSAFIDKLWRAVCVRLLTEMLEALKAGHNLYFGDAVLHDDNVILVKHKFLGANEKVWCSWSDVHVWSADGSFYIGAKDDKKTYVGLSYINSANTHILEQAIRMLFKRSDIKRLSELLQ
jgi:hypothetical protein